MKSPILSLMLIWLVSLVPTRAMAHDGPHGGELFCDGKHAWHTELCVDAKSGKATVYILDKKAKKEVPIGSETISIQMKGIEKPLLFEATNSKEGKSSQFVLHHDRFKSKFKPSELTMHIVLEKGKPAVTFTPEHEDD